MKADRRRTRITKLEIRNHSGHLVHSGEEGAIGGIQGPFDFVTTNLRDDVDFKALRHKGLGRETGYHSEWEWLRVQRRHMDEEGFDTVWHDMAFALHVEVCFQYMEAYSLSDQGVEELRKYLRKYHKQHNVQMGLQEIMDVLVKAVGDAEGPIQHVARPFYQRIGPCWVQYVRFREKLERLILTGEIAQ